VSVRRATRDEVPALSETLARASIDDPWLRWTLPEKHRFRRIRRLYELFVGAAIDEGEVWTVDGGAAVAAWLLPGVRGPSDAALAAMAEELPKLFGDRVERSADGGALLDAARPHAPHWYLSSVAVAPDRHREGLGAQVLAPVLARCDAEGTFAWAETALEPARLFLEAQGFATAGTLAMPRGGPTMLLLRREPRRTAGAQD
jgi:GNAT superfamily N-acetyltransferase